MENNQAQQLSKDQWLGQAQKILWNRVRLPQELFDAAINAYAEGQVDRAYETGWGAEQLAAQMVKLFGGELPETDPDPEMFLDEEGLEYIHGFKALPGQPMSAERFCDLKGAEEMRIVCDMNRTHPSLWKGDEEQRKTEREVHLERHNIIVELLAEVERCMRESGEFERGKQRYDAHVKAQTSVMSDAELKEHLRQKQVVKHIKDNIMPQVIESLNESLKQTPESDDASPI